MTERGIPQMRERLVEALVARAGAADPGVSATTAPRVSAKTAPGVSAEEEPATGAAVVPHQPTAPTQEPGEGPVADLAEACRTQIHEVNDAYLRRIGGWSLGLIAISPIIVWTAVGGVRTTGLTVRLSAPARAAFWATVVLAVAMVLLALVLRESGGARSLLIGKDGRFSTANTQIAIWTLVIVFSLLLLVIADGFGGSGDEDEGRFDLSPAYLVLLGGPFAAAGLSRLAVQRKLEDGTMQRTTAVETGPSDVVKNSDGAGDLVDVQFLAFNLVVLVYFAVAFVREPSSLPPLPWELVSLTSLGALAYTGSKFAASNAPTITSVTRREGDGAIRPGDEVLIRGNHLVPDGATAPEMLHLLRVRFGTREVAAVPDGNVGGKDVVRTRLYATVPSDAKGPLLDVTVVTPAGAESNSHALAVDDDVPAITGAAPLPVTPGAELTLTGRFFVRAGHGERVEPAMVMFGDLPQTASETSPTMLKVSVPATIAGGTVSVTVTAGGGMTASPAVVLPVAPAPQIHSVALEPASDGAVLVVTGDFGVDGWSRDHILQVDGHSLESPSPSSRYVLRAKLPQRILDVAEARKPAQLEVTMIDGLGRSGDAFTVSLP